MPQQCQHLSSNANTTAAVLTPYQQHKQYSNTVNANAIAAAQQNSSSAIVITIATMPQQQSHHHRSAKAHQWAHSIYQIHTSCF